MTDIVSPPTIDAMPPAPQPTDTREQFNAKAFPHAAAQQTLVTQVNAANVATHQNAVATNERAVAANGSAQAAQAAAEAAVPASAAAVAAAQAAVPAAAQATAAAQSAQENRAYIEGLLPALEDGPVLSVNNKSGVVSLAATDVGATPAPHLTPAGIALAGGPMNCQAGDYFTETVNGSRAFAFTNIPAGAYFCSLEILHTSGTFTLPAGSVWSGGTVPTFQTNKRHVLDFQRSQIGSGGWLVTARTGFAP